MNFINLYVDAFKKILDIKGKAGRMEFWAFVLISLLIVIVLKTFIPAVAGLYSIVALVALITLSIRRGRDFGSPLWALLLLVPFGVIILGLLPRK